MSKYAILFIDADKKFAKRIAKSLPKTNVKHKFAEDGATGLKMAKKGPFLAIVLDVELPGMSGYAVCNKLKGNKATRDVPLIMTSSEATTETFKQHRKLKSRAQAYVLKGQPDTDAELRDAIHQLAFDHTAPAALLPEPKAQSEAQPQPEPKPAPAPAPLAQDGPGDDGERMDGASARPDASGTAGHRCRCGATDWLQTTATHLGLSSTAYDDRVKAFVCAQCGVIDLVTVDPSSLHVDGLTVRRVRRVTR